MADRPMDDAKLGAELRADLTALILLGMFDSLVKTRFEEVPAI